MGAQFSKGAAKGETAAAEKPGEAAASCKPNGQENGHVKVNGDAPPAEGKGGVQANGSAATEEQPKEEKGEKAEDAAAVDEKEGGVGEQEQRKEKEEGESAAVPSEGEAATPSTSNDTPKKKKQRFSFKKSFKLSSFSFRKSKKETEEEEEEATGHSNVTKTEEGEEAKPEVVEDTGVTVKPEAQEKPSEDTKTVSPAEEAPNAVQQSSELTAEPASTDIQEEAPKPEEATPDSQESNPAATN